MFSDSSMKARSMLTLVLADVSKNLTPFSRAIDSPSPWDAPVTTAIFILGHAPEEDKKPPEGMPPPGQPVPEEAPPSPARADSKSRPRAPAAPRATAMQRWDTAARGRPLFDYGPQCRRHPPAPREWTPREADSGQTLQQAGDTARASGYGPGRRGAFARVGARRQARAA